MSGDKEEVKCVFCDTVKTDKVLLFSEDTISKCRKILRLRKFHKLKYNDVVLPDEMYDSRYSSCYKTFTALKRQFISTDVKKTVLPQPSTSSSEIQQPSTSSDNLITSDTAVYDPLVKDVSLSETEEVAKEIEAEAELEERPSEDSEEAPTAQASDPVVSSNMNLCFFL